MRDVTGYVVTLHFRLVIFQCRLLYILLLIYKFYAGSVFDVLNHLNIYITLCTAIVHVVCIRNV